METLNNYYTPTIEEFYANFEFEYSYTSGKLISTIKPESGWKKDTFDWQWSETINDDWEHENEDFKLRYRVKYLDQSDIESLGWEFKTKGPFRYWFEGKDSWFNNDIPDSPSGRYWGFQLVFDQELHTIQISAKTNGGEQTYEPFFQGYCKNKSELIKLMQQLNIK